MKKLAGAVLPRLAALGCIVLFVLASTLMTYASEEGTPAWNTYKSGDVQVFFSEKTDEIEKIIAQAIIKPAKRNNAAMGCCILASDIIKVTDRQNRNTIQYRIFAYVSYGAFVRGSDGTYQIGETKTAPYEIYASKNLKTGKLSVFSAGTIPPRRLAPEVWDEYGITDATYDASMLLKQNITKEAPPALAKQAMAFLDSDKQFSQSVWTEILGKSFEAATDTEIAQAFRGRLSSTQERYREARKQYDAQYPNRLPPL